MRPLRFGVIPTNGRDCVDQAVAALWPQVDHLLVVQAGDNINFRDYPEGVAVAIDQGKPNISRWWNRGIDWARNVAAASRRTQWDVAIINDDVIVPNHWLCYVADDLRQFNATVGCSGGPGDALVIHRQAGPVPLQYRMQGFAFVLVGESGLRADEDLVWWYGDDLLGAQAAQAGGMAMKPQCHVQHLYPNGQTAGELLGQTALDRQTFVEKMGYAPW